MSPTLRRLSQPMRTALSIALILGALSGLLYAVPVLRTFFSEWASKGVEEKPVDRVFSIYETDAYQWYVLNHANEVHTAAMPPQHSSTSNEVTLPNTMVIAISEKGLVWRNPTAKNELVLIAREGITPDIGAVAPDGSAAVLFNQATNQFDVFKVYDGGASVSYIDSLETPTLPTYFSGVGFVSPTVFAIHTGRPNNFDLYSIDTTVTFVSSAPYVVTPQ